MNTAVAHSSDDLSQQMEECHKRIQTFQSEIEKLESELVISNQELDDIADERRRYDVLTGTCENLEKLRDYGGNDLFWSDLLPEDQIEEYLNRLREKVDFFQRRIGKVTGRNDEIKEKIENKKLAIGGLEDEIAHLKEREEEARFEYLVERQETQQPYRAVIMPWTKQAKDERDYRKILLIALFISILAGVLIPLYDAPIPDRAEHVKIPERLAKLLKKKQQPKPKPKPKEVKAEEKKAEKKPTEKERKKAKEKVKSKGVLAFKNNFADLLEDDALEKLGANTNLSNAGSTAKRTRRSIITAQATSGSSGIKSSSLSRNVAGTGDQIGAVAFSRVESAIGTAVAEDRLLSDGPGPARTDEEIQIVFDKYKAALYRIYNRALRKNPTLQGKVVLRMTIAPDGTVSACKVESTDMNEKQLMSKIVARVKKFNFGAKEGVPPTSILYPIDFLPAS